MNTPSGRGPITRSIAGLHEGATVNRARGGQNLLTTRTTRGTFQRPLKAARGGNITQQNQTPRWL